MNLKMLTEEKKSIQANDKVQFMFTFPRIYWSKAESMRCRVWI